MPLTSEHGQYEAARRRWVRCRDVIEGEDAIKAKGKTYLPDLGYATEQDNESYRMRAPWYGAVSRTITGLVGCVFRVPPSFKAPRMVEMDLMDSTLTGLSIQMLAQSLFRDVLSVGRAAVQIDMTPDGERVYWRHVRAECVRNWQTCIINGARVLTRVVIRECISINTPVDQYENRDIDEIRVLELIDGQAVETRWRELVNCPMEAQSENGMSQYGWARMGEPVVLTRRGMPLDRLPIYLFGTTEVSFDIQRPPLLDMVDLSLSLFRTQADLEWGAHRTALPTPVIIGADTEGSSPLGPGGVWMLPMGADAKMLEFSGAGLASLAKLVDQKVAQIAALGARIIESSRRAAETAESVRLKTGSDTSLLSAIASAFDACMTSALRMHAWWSATTDDMDDDSISFNVNRDFLDAKLGSQDIMALVSAWQAGAIPLDTLHENLLKGEIIMQETGIREVQRQLERERQQRMERAMAGPMMMPKNGNGSEEEEDDDVDTNENNMGQ